MLRFTQAATALALTATLVAGCGGGGGGGGSSVPGPTPSTVVPTPVPSNPPGIAGCTKVSSFARMPDSGTSGTTGVQAVSTPVPGGFVPATGPITDLPFGTGSIGSNMLPGSSAAQFIAQEGSTPPQPNTGQPLQTLPIAVSETAGLSTSSRGFAQRTVDRVSGEEADMHWDVPQTAFSSVYRNIQNLQREPRSVSRQSVRKTQAYSVGNSRTFYVLTTNINGSNAGSGVPCSTITATLLSQSAHANVWLDNGIYLNPTEMNAEYPSGLGDFQTVSNFFESAFATETAAFGSAYLNGGPNFRQCSSNGGTPTSQEPLVDLSGTADPHINIVITNLLASLGEGGYFFSGDLIVQQALNCAGSNIPPSNELAMFYIGSDFYPSSGGAANGAINNETFWLNSDMKRSISHEFQHYLHNVNKYLRPLAAGQAGVFDDAWIDEGCSMLAEDLAGNGIVTDTPRFSYAYLANPDEYSLTSFTGYNPNPLATGTNPPYNFYRNTAGNYGMSYLFLRYVYDRFGQAGIQRLYANLSPGGSPFSANTAPIVAAANGEPFSQLYREFAIAVASQNSVTTTDPRYTFSSQIVLNGPVTVTSRIKSSGMRTLFFGGPQPPVDISQAPVNGVLPMPPLTPGNALNLTLLAGATMFFHPQPVSGGATLRASANSTTFQGGLVQGNFPTPMPTAP